MERKEFEIVINYAIHFRICGVNQPSVTAVVFAGLIQVGEGKAFENSRIVGMRGSFLWLI